MSIMDTEYVRVHFSVVFKQRSFNCVVHQSFGPRWGIGQWESWGYRGAIFAVELECQLITATLNALAGPGEHRCKSSSASPSVPGFGTNSNHVYLGLTLAIQEWSKCKSEKLRAIEWENHSPNGPMAWLCALV